LERVSQYQTCDCDVPILSAKGFCPPAISQASLSGALVFIRPPYPDLGKSQPRNLSGTHDPRLGKFPAVPKVDKVAFGKRVLERRKKIGISAAKLAEAVGMKQQGIANIEKGIVERPRRLMELARALETTEDWLLYREGPEILKPATPLEEMMTLVHNVPPGKEGLAIQFLRSLSDDADKKVA
jgi:transcriptional regulator with XRE-family HTH domain